LENVCDIKKIARILLMNIEWEFSNWKIGFILKL
jgi:hypothetical protein